MATARMYPTPAQRGRGHKLNSSIIEEFKKVSAGNLSQARLVLAYSRDLADEVLSGATAWADAYKEAQERQKAAPFYGLKKFRMP